MSVVKRVNLVLCGLVVCLFVANYGQASRRLRYWYAGTVKIDKLTFHLNPDDESITATMIEDGLWEPIETSVLRSQLKPGDTFIDVGANIGYYTVLGSKLVGENGRVIAFEPDPVSFALLERNVEANGCKNVILEEKALSNEPGTIKLFIAQKNKGGHKIYEFEGQTDFVEVEAVRLDDYLRDYQREIDFVKLDTEGAEGAIVEGMRETLRKNRNMKLMVEYYPMLLETFGYDAAQLLNEFQSQGFEVGVIGHDGAPLFNEFQSGGFEVCVIDDENGKVFSVGAEELLKLTALLEEGKTFANLFLQRRVQ